MQFDIEFVNTTVPTVNYSAAAVAEHAAGLGNGIDKYTQQFETEHSLSPGEDLGGLIVYAAQGQVQAVYDYENFCGWLV